MLRLLIAAGTASAEEWPCRLSKADRFRNRATLKCDFGSGKDKKRDCPGSGDICELSNDQWAALGRQAKKLKTKGSAATEGICTVTCRECDSWRKKYFSSSAYTVACVKPVRGELLFPCENLVQQCGRGFEGYELEEEPYLVEQECVLEACEEVAGKSCLIPGLQSLHTHFAKAAHNESPRCTSPDETPAPGAVCRNGIWWIEQNGAKVAAVKHTDICKHYCEGRSHGKRVLFGQPALCEGTQTPSGWTCGDDLHFVKGDERTQYLEDTQQDCAGSIQLYA